MENRVIGATFDSENAAFEAAKEIQGLEKSGAITIKHGAIISKDESGNVTVPVSRHKDSAWGVVGGGVIGAMLGLLLGPGGAAGAMGAALAGMTVGAAGDNLSGGLSLDKEDELLDAVMSGIEPGQTVLLAELDEQSTELVEAAVTRQGGRIFRTGSTVSSKAEQAQEDVERHLAHQAAKIDSKIAADDAQRDWENDQTKEGDIETLRLVTINQQSQYDVYANSQGPASTRPLDEVE